MSDALLLALLFVVVTVVCATIAVGLWAMVHDWWTPDDLPRGLPWPDQQRNRDQQHRDREQWVSRIEQRRHRQQQRHDDEDDEC